MVIFTFSRGQIYNDNGNYNSNYVKIYCYGHGYLYG